MGSVDLSGFKKQLEKLSGPAIRSACQKAVIASAQIVELRAVDLCPEDTGVLRESIESSHSGPFEGIVSANTEYAEAVHNGSSRRAPDPFLTDAMNESERDILTAFKIEIKREVDKL